MTLMLVDAAGLYFRAFYGVKSGARSPDGQPINAVRGYLDMTAALITRRRPSRYVACLDVSWRPAFRSALVPSYKAHRALPDGSEDVPADLASQVPVLLDVLAALGLCAAGAEGFEADDVIATLALRADQAGERAEVVTGDRDLMAVATERVRVLYVGRGMAKLEDLGPAEIEAKYGIAPERYPDFAVLRGDASDGLPGVSGIGERTSAAIVQRFGAIEDILAAAREGSAGFPSGAAPKVLAAADYLPAAAAVVRARIDAPVPPLDDALPRTPAAPERLIELTDRWGLGSSAERMLQALALARE
jgi:5'-3' exonuclease